jgi:hypothetical protein
MMIVQYLSSRLPAGYVAAPSVHLGSAFEVDVTTFAEDEPTATGGNQDGNGGVATATWAPPAPTCTLDVDLPVQDEYEVRVYDTQRGRRLVAAIEIVSPSNKDRPQSRQAFVAKIVALLQEGVCVSIVDVVTVRQSNLYAELVELMGRTDPAWNGEPPHLYAVTLRYRTNPVGLDSWFHKIEPGKPLPTLHLWLSEALGVALDLEATYEDNCKVLRIA